MYVKDDSFNASSNLFNFCIISFVKVNLLLMIQKLLPLVEQKKNSKDTVLALWEHPLLTFANS